MNKRTQREMVYTIGNIVLLTVDNRAWQGIKKENRAAEIVVLLLLLIIIIMALWPVSCIDKQ